jgi:hypothetical protein
MSVILLDHRCDKTFAVALEPFGDAWIKPLRIVEDWL